MTRLVCVDIETAGADPKRHPIIQVAAVAIDGQGEPLEAFETKLRFDTARANVSSLRKSHYHPGVWARESRSPRDAAIVFAQFLRRHGGHAQVSARGQQFTVSQLVAHNAAFDAPFLWQWFDKADVYLPARRLVLCTMQLAMWKAAQSVQTPPPQNFQLATLCRHYHVPFHASSAHDALGDATATVLLYQALVAGFVKGRSTA